MTIQDQSLPASGAAFPAPDCTVADGAAQPVPSVKRVLDVILSLIALILLLPVFGAIALAVVWDSGEPVFFRQRRIGRHGKVFNIYKFRTMHVLEDGAEIVQAFKGDARITRIGHFLRVTSLDELPQLWNVLKGEMSLVGPRPHAIAHDEYYSALIQNYHLRYAVKPGITGWAQINGARGATPLLSDMQTRIDFDIQYVERESLWLYLQILARTPLVVLGRRNAV
mgnify:CR=1 FL=1